MNLIEYRVERKQKVEARDALKAKATAMVSDAHAEGRALGEDEQKVFDGIVAEVKSLDGSVANLNSLIASLEQVGGDEPAEAPPAQAGARSKPFAFPQVKVAKDHKYDAVRAVRGYYAGKLDGLEREYHDEVCRTKAPLHGGIMLPTNAKVHLRADFTTTQGAGSVVTHVDTNVIEYLRNKMVFTQMGARFLDGLPPGNLDMPRQSGTATAAWVTEGNATTASAADVTGKLSLVPQTLTAYTNITRLLMQKSAIPSVAEFIAQDLFDGIANKLDNTGLNGTGSSEPTGMLNDSSITTISLGTNGAAVAYADLLTLEKTVAEQNAESGKLGFVTSPAGRSKLKNTAKIGSTFPVYLWEQDNTMIGVPAYASTQVPKTLTKGTSSSVCTAVVYGNWEDYIIATWGEGIEIVEDPYSLATSGGKRLVALVDAAFGARHGGSFAKIVDFVY